jgi:hypothetical protein
VTFTLQAPAPSAGQYALDARIWIDDAPVGSVSSLRQPASVEVRRFTAGVHRYRIAATLYGFDAMLQLNPGGRSGGEGLVTVNDGDVFAVRWAAGEPPSLQRQ